MTLEQQINTILFWQSVNSERHNHPYSNYEFKSKNLPTERKISARYTEVTDGYTGLPLYLAINK